MEKIGIFFILMFLFAGLNVYADNESTANHGEENQIQNNVQGESEDETGNTEITNETEEGEPVLISQNPNSKGKYTTAKESWANAKNTWLSKKDSTNKQAMIQKGSDFLVNSIDKTEEYFLKLQEKLQEKERLVLAEKIQEKLQTMTQIREQIQIIKTTKELEDYALKIKNVWKEKAVVKNAIHLSVLYNAYNYNEKLEELIIKLDKRIEILKNKGYDMQEIETSMEEIKAKIISAKQEYTELEAEYNKMEQEEDYENIDFLKESLQDFHSKVQEIRQEIAQLTLRIREKIQEGVVE